MIVTERHALWFSSLDRVGTLWHIQCSLSPPPRGAPSLPEFMKGIVQFPLFRTPCQLTGSYQWEPFVEKARRSTGSPVLREVLSYAEFGSWYRASFHWLNFGVSQFIANLAYPTWGEQGVSTLVCSHAGIDWEVHKNSWEDFFFFQSNLAKAKVVFRAFELDY